MSSSSTSRSPAAECASEVVDVRTNAHIDDRDRSHIVLYRVQEEQKRLAVNYRSWQ